MKHRVTALCVAGSLALGSFIIGSGTASAAPVRWADVNGDLSLGENSILLTVSNGRVKLSILQVVMQCTDRASGRVDPTAFWIYDYGTRARLSRTGNFHFATFAYEPTGLSPLSDVEIGGRLRNNGTGVAHVRLEGSQIDGGTGETLADCTGSIDFIHLLSSNTPHS